MNFRAKCLSVVFLAALMIQKSAHSQHKGSLLEPARRFSGLGVSSALNHSTNYSALTTSDLLERLWRLERIAPTSGIEKNEEILLKHPQGVRARQMFIQTELESRIFKILENNAAPKALVQDMLQLEPTVGFPEKPWALSNEWVKFLNSLNHQTRTELSQSLLGVFRARLATTDGQRKPKKVTEVLIKNTDPHHLADLKKALWIARHIRGQIVERVHDYKVKLNAADSSASSHAPIVTDLRSLELIAKEAEARLSFAAGLDQENGVRPIFGYALSTCGMTNTSHCFESMENSSNFYFLDSTIPVQEAIERIETGGQPYNAAQNPAF